MSTKYEDWTDWAGDHPEQVEADLRERATKLEARLAEHRNLTRQPIEDRDGADSAALYAAERRSCEHEAVDNQGVCENCGDEVEGWEPDDSQLLPGTKDPRWLAA